MSKIFFFKFTFLILFLTSTAFAKTKTLVILGDSLTEGYGVTKNASFPELIQQMVQKDKLDWKIIGAGVSGSTTASGLSRMKWLAKEKPDVVLYALGSNDALRGFKPELVEKNIADAIEWAQKNGITVFIDQLEAPPNYGNEYTKSFEKIFPKLAKKYNVTLIPYILNDIAGKPELNQADGIHPNEKGHKVLAVNLYKHLLPHLKKN